MGTMPCRSCKISSHCFGPGTALSSGTLISLVRLREFPHQKYIYVCVCYRIYIYNVCTYVIVFEIRLFPRSTTTISLSNLRGPRARIYAVPPHMSRWPQDHTWCELDSLILNTSIQYYTIWVCLKMGYAPNYSHLVGIMIINHWV
jgi:hypothetical protein